MDRTSDAISLCVLFKRGCSHRRAGHLGTEVWSTPSAVAPSEVTIGGFGQRDRPDLNSSRCLPCNRRLACKWLLAGINMSPWYEWQTTISQSALVDETHNFLNSHVYPTVQIFPVWGTPKLAHRSGEVHRTRVGEKNVPNTWALSNSVPQCPAFFLRPIAHQASKRRFFKRRISGDTRFCSSARRAGFVPLGSSFQASSPGVRSTRRVKQSWSYFWRVTPGTDLSEQEQRGVTPASDRNIKTGLTKMSDLNDDVWKLIQSRLFFFFCGPFLHSPTLKHQRQQRKNTKRLFPSKDSLGKAILTICPRDSRLCHTWNSAKLNCRVCVCVWVCVCVADVHVHTFLVACIGRFACADAWRRRLPPSLESPPVCDGPLKKGARLRGLESGAPLHVSRTFALVGGTLSLS